MGVARMVAVLGRSSRAGNANCATSVQRGPITSLLGEPSANPSLAVRSIIFDTGGVLYDATLWRRWLLRLLAHLGKNVSARSFFRDWENDYLGDVYLGRREYGEALHAFLLSQGLTWGQIDEIEAASRSLHAEIETGERALPDVAATLEQLVERGFRLAVLANSPFPAEQLLSQLERIGIGNRFEAVVSSCDIEVAKPRLECYAAVLAALGLPAGETAYVGHSAAELAGAKAAGLRTVAFNYESESQADVFVTRFADLLSRIELAG
jgi:HAD superfamily hydrolase (TIGR01509 family)